MLPLIGNIASRAATPAKWLIVLGMAYTLASTVLFVAAPADAVPTRPANAAANNDESRPSTDATDVTDVKSILNANLFGTLPDEDTGADPLANAAHVTLAETRLPLVLHGVFVADAARESTAILSRKGQPERLYHIGEALPGDATLEAVHLDYVLLMRGRSRERLTFPQSENRLVVPSDRKASTPINISNSKAMRLRGTQVRQALDTAPPVKLAPGEISENYRDKLRDAPIAALRELGLMPVRDADASGYRIDSAAGTSPYLRRAGLQPGDLILSINGQPVENLGGKQFDPEKLLVQGSARLEVQRGKRRFFITASLK